MIFEQKSLEPETRVILVLVLVLSSVDVGDPRMSSPW